MERKLLWILCVLSIFTFTTSLFSSLLIYFNDNNHTRVNSNSVTSKITKYKKSMIVYENGKHVDIRNIGAGFDANYLVSITNDNSDDISFQIKWDNVKNDWNPIDYQNFIYSVNCDNGAVIDNQSMPFSSEGKVILSPLVVSSNKTVSCGIRVRYNSNYLEQTSNVFTADIDVLVVG